MPACSGGGRAASGAGIVFAVLVLGLLCVRPEPGQSQPWEGEKARVAECSGASLKSLTRFPDPVLLQGQWLSDLQGSRLDCLRVYRCRQGRFEAIRFQVDERTADGDWVFPHGKRNTRDRGNGILDSRDVVLFMAREAGDRAPGGARPDQALRVSEIVLEDPAHGGRGWVYLACHADPGAPRSSLPDYVRYNYDTEEVVTDVVYSRFIITRDGRHTGFSDVGGPPPLPGGTVENRLDRVKFRLLIRFLFDLIPLSLHEEATTQDVVAYISGPIRVVRRLEQFLKLPLGLKGLRTFTDLQHYESLAVVPVEIHVPRGVHRVISSSVIRFGVDYSPRAIGSLFRSSENPEALIVDGRMSESEKLFCTRQDKWRVMYGAAGAMVSRALFSPELEPLVEIRQGYLDDNSVSLPPERYPGSIGYVSTEILTKKSRSGTYRILMDVYFPGEYRAGDEAAYLEVRDQPLNIRIQDRQYANELNPDGGVGRDFD